MLAIENLSKRFGRAGQQVLALDGFSAHFGPGELIGLLGPNGAGKTTLLRCLTRLCEPDSGHILLQGQALSQAQLGRVGLLLEGRGNANERLSAWENARYLCGLREARFDAAWVQQLASLLSLPDLHAPLRLLSTGNRLRAALLLTLVHRPALLLLDEPSLGLDLFGLDQLRALLQRAVAEGTTVLLSSHDLQLVESLAQRVICVHQGRKRFDGARSDFVSAQSGYLLRGLCDGQPQQHRVADHAQLCALLAQLQPQLPQWQQLSVEPLTLEARYREILKGQAP